MFDTNQIVDGSFWKKVPVTIELDMVQKLTSGSFTSTLSVDTVELSHHWQVLVSKVQPNFALLFYIFIEKSHRTINVLT